ncbi:MAG: hypothetical protein IPL32_18760 [Chloracidobacterium sp.]|nr:hypothetical protein [Chloracidobacterium sp.]
MRHPATVLKAYHLGDHMDDDELEMLAMEMQAIADNTAKFGEMFRLQTVYADKVAYDCKAFLRSRRERAA